MDGSNTNVFLMENVKLYKPKINYKIWEVYPK